MIPLTHVEPSTRSGSTNLSVVACACPRACERLREGCRPNIRKAYLPEGNAVADFESGNNWVCKQIGIMRKARLPLILKLKTIQPEWSLAYEYERKEL